MTRLLSRGGWELDDVQARHSSNPEGFWLPPPEQIAKLGPGTTARLIFAIADQADPVRDGITPYSESGAPNLVVQCERMWVWVEQVLAEGFIGVLQNLPLSTHTRLVPGARVRFRARDVIDLDLNPPVQMAEELASMAELGFPILEEAATLAPEDPLRLPTIPPNQAETCAKAGVRPERPWAFSRCLVGKSVNPDSVAVHGGRFKPQPEKGDCGWVIWSGGADMEAEAKRNPLEIVEVRSLYERNLGAWAQLALPPGWAFVLGANGYSDVYRDPDLLE